MSYLPYTVEQNIISNFFDCCYSPAESVPEIITRFSDSLKKDENVPEDITVLIENALFKYRDIITKPVYLADFRTTFNEVHDLLASSPDIPSFKLEGRCKSAINSVEKLIKLLKEGRSLDLFRDALGIRLVLFGRKDDEEKTQEKLYEISTIIIKFLLSKGFILCHSDNLPKKEKLQDGIHITVPKESKIPEIYRNCVKDMVFYHKANGYQSIQMAFRAPNGACIEIQLRTEQMHLHAEYFEADHKIYKLTEYTGSPNGKRLKEKIDFTKVNLPGFRYIGLQDKKYADYVGLSDSLRIYFRTFIQWHSP